jgi:hypothetical protein
LDSLLSLSATAPCHTVSIVARSARIDGERATALHTRSKPWPSSPPPAASPSPLPAARSPRARRSPRVRRKCAADRPPAPRPQPRARDAFSDKRSDVCVCFLCPPPCSQDRPPGHGRAEPRPEQGPPGFLEVHGQRHPDVSRRSGCCVGAPSRPSVPGRLERVARVRLPAAATDTFMCGRRSGRTGGRRARLTARSTSSPAPSPLAASVSS